jgi:hypothetical protein
LPKITSKEWSIRSILRLFPMRVYSSLSSFISRPRCALMLSMRFGESFSNTVCSIISCPETMRDVCRS